MSNRSGLDPRVGALLGEHETLVLATVNTGGQPQATAVFFLPEEDEDGFRLVTAMLSRSNKLAYLRHEPRAGVFIGPPRPERWLQAECTASILEADDEGERRLKQLSEGVPAARVFIERVPVTPVLLRVRRLKLTDLTGGQPPVVTIDFEQDSPERATVSG